MGDSEQQNDNQPQAENGQGQDQEKEKGEGKKRTGKRDSAAKAFYRAMYAGAEPDPDDFGIKLDKEEEQNEDQARQAAASSALAKRLEGELEAAEARAVEAENLYKRLAADFENYRKRMQREREEMTASGIQRAIDAILPALDDMDLAKSKLDENIDPKNMIESLNMVYNRFARCLEQIGIKQLDVIGEPFDPRLHEPVQQVVTDEVPDGAIVQQLRPGYTFNDKVLRPSLVNVATSGDESEEVEEETEDEEVEEVVEEAVEEGSEEETEEEGEEEVDEEEEEVEVEEEVAEEGLDELDLGATQDIPAFHAVEGDEGTEDKSD